MCVLRYGNYPWATIWNEKTPPIKTFIRPPLFIANIAPFFIIISIWFKAIFFSVLTDKDSCRTNPRGLFNRVVPCEIRRNLGSFSESSYFEHCSLNFSCSYFYVKPVFCTFKNYLKNAIMPCSMVNNSKPVSSRDITSGYKANEMM